MPRVGPNYTLPQPPFQPQTPISSAAVNSDLSDIADALTASLARNGAGGMTAVLPLANDGLTFQNDPDTGISRSAANTMSFECGNSEVMEVSPAGVDVTGALTQNGAAIIPVGLGPLPWPGTAAPAKWVLCRGQSLLRASYPALWDFAQGEIALGNTFFTNGDGSTNFTIADLSGATPFGSNNGTGRLTVANSGVNGDILGSVGGMPNPTIVTANLPPYTPSGSIATTHGREGTFPFFISSSQPTGSAQPGGNQMTYPISGSTSAALTLTSLFTGNGQGGISTPIKTQPRTIITNYIIYAGA